MWFSPSIRHVSRSKIHIYSCSQHILMATITPTTSIKSSISFYSKSIKVFQNTDLRFNKFYLLSSEKEIGNDVTFPGGGIQGSFIAPYDTFRSKIHIYSCSQHILMTTITPTTSIKSSISFISNLKVFQNTDLRFNKSYLLSSGKEIGNDVTFPKEGSFIAPYDA